MGNFRVRTSTRARRNGSDHREMKLRIAFAAVGFVTIGSGTKGCESDLTDCNHRAHKVKRKEDSAVGESAGGVVTAPQGKVISEGTQKAS